MKNYLIASLFALISGFVGMFLPFAGGLPILTNIPLGFVYGFGWFVAGFIKNVRSPNVQLFGSIIWPLVVMVAIIYFLGRTLSRHPDRSRAINAGCIISLLLIVPGDLVHRTKLSKYVPLYSNILASVY